MMISFQALQKFALSLPEAKEEPHFEKTSFRVNKKIFATYDSTSRLACLKLSESDQDVFSMASQDTIYPVPNKWGKQGWTFVDVQKVKKDILCEAVVSAYCQVAPKKLVEKIKRQ